MQLMTFNSLLMFDIVFIFFLFLVCVTCLVYYLPPRELPSHTPSPTPPDEPDEDQRACQEPACLHHHHHHHHLLHHYHPTTTTTGPPGCCDGPPKPPVLVRDSAAAARRISGGGTPAISLSDLRELGRAVAKEEPPVCRAPITDRIYGSEMALPGPALESYLQHAPPPSPLPQHLQQPAKPDALMRESHRPAAGPEAPTADVLLLDCTLEDMLTGTGPAMMMLTGPHSPASPILSPSLRRAGRGSIDSDLLGRYRRSEQPPCELCSCQQPPDLSTYYTSPAVRRWRPPSPVVVSYHRTGVGLGGRGQPPSAGATAAKLMTGVPPACCYVRAKTNDTKECRGPIHNV